MHVRVLMHGLVWVRACMHARSGFGASLHEYTRARIRVSVFVSASERASVHVRKRKWVRVFMRGQR